MCAGVDIGTQGSCKGDSGGPLMMKDFKTTKWTQIATVQGGIGFKNINFLMLALLRRMKDFFGAFLLGLCLFLNL